MACGTIRPGGGLSLAERLHAIQSAFHAVVTRLRPTSAAVEAPFHGVNARSALQLAHARGVLLAVLAGEGVEVVEYSPAVVKKAVTGNGRAEKRQVQTMLRGLLDPASTGIPESSDAADAVGVALCHAATLAFRDAVDPAGRR